MRGNSLRDRAMSAPEWRREEKARLSCGAHDRQGGCASPPTSAA